MTERRADEATRDAAEWLKCEYMLNKVGEIFDGIVSGVTAFGLFIELEKVFVEGLLHVTSLPNDYYHFDPVGHSMQGKRTGKTYRLGDPVRIVVARVDLDERKIDFELAQKKSTSGRKQRRKK
jgi:ribonuclease R